MTTSKRTGSAQLTHEMSVTELVMRDIYSDSGILPRYPDESRGDAIRRRRTVRQPITDANRAEARSRTRITWQSASDAVIR